MYPESSEVSTEEDTILHAEAAVPENAINKAQARAYTKQIAYHLRNKYGVGQNGAGKDVVVCISSGQILLPVVFYAVIAAGGVYSAASSSFTSPELARQVKQGESRLIITSIDCKETAMKAARDCGIPPNRVLVLESDNHQRILQDVTGKSPNLLQNPASKDGYLDWQRITDPKALEDSIVCLLYSSGTTGAPKGE